MSAPPRPAPARQHPALTVLVFLIYAGAVIVGALCFAAML